MRKGICAAAIVPCCATLLLAGCAGVAPSPYASPTEDVVGSPSRFEPRQLSQAVATAIQKMLTDPTFTDSYGGVSARAAELGRRLPVLAVTPVANNSGDGRGDASTRQVFEALKNGLRKTGRFEVVDYVRRGDITGTVRAGRGAGDDDEALQHFGSYLSPDLILSADITRDVTDDRGRKVYFHYLNLTMQSTETGSVFWSETIEVAKQVQQRSYMWSNR